MEDKDVVMIPYIVHEGDMARQERTIKRLWILCILLVILLCGSNAAWFYHESQYEDVVTTTQEVIQDNNNGKYEPSNCRWITMLEQCKNRRGAVLITYKGETHSTKEWANITGLPQHTIYQRYKYGWEPAEIFTPIDQHRKRNPKHHKISSTQNAG